MARISRAAHHFSAEQVLAITALAVTRAADAPGKSRPSSSVTSVPTYADSPLSDFQLSLVYMRQQEDPFSCYQQAMQGWV